MQVVQRKRSIVMNLVLINVLVFVAQAILGKALNLFVLNSATVFFQPWQLVTHMFMHASFSHIFFNMYALFLFGPLIEQKIGSKRFLWFYLITGVIAAIGYVIYDYLMVYFGITTSLGSAVGASGAIMGVLGLVIMLLPNLKVLFFFVIPMTMRTAGFIFAAIDLIGLFNPGSTVANIAHLVGLACGLLFGYYLIKQRNKFNRNFTKPRYSSKVNRSTDPNNVVIELSDEDVDSYLKNGRI